MGGGWRSADRPQGKREAAQGEGDAARTAKLEALAARRYAGLIVVLEDIGNNASGWLTRLALCDSD